MGQVNIRDLAERLQIGPLPERWSTLSEQTEADAAWFLPEQLQKFQEETDLFPTRLRDVLVGAEAVWANVPLRQYCVILSRAMDDRDAFMQELGQIQLPKAKEGESPLAYDYMGLFALLPQSVRTMEQLRQRGVPEEIILATFRALEGTLAATEARLGRPMFNDSYFGWTQHFLNGVILRIGRLEFHRIPSLYGAEFAVFRSDAGEYRLLAVCGTYDANGRCKKDDAAPEISDITVSYTETETYFEGNAMTAQGTVCRETVRLSKASWKKVCDPSSPALTVHIPIGPGLTPENVHASYAKALEVMESCYPEFSFPVLHCGSWLMDTQLADMLPAESNMVKFQSDYLHGNTIHVDSGVFSFLFTHPYSRNDLPGLPERTTLERKMKQHLLSGQHSYDQVGIIPVELLKTKILK